jgi:hypothetical protein
LRWEHQAVCKLRHRQRSTQVIGGSGTFGQKFGLSLF